MNLYRVTNGHLGTISFVRCLVLAENTARAVELAREKFKAENPDYPGYYTDLNSELIFLDCSKERSGEVTDE
jgi:hypothetical protein